MWIPKKAIVWSDKWAASNNGNGWRQINLNELRPIDWVASKSAHNELGKVRLTSAIFECSDCTTFNSKDYTSVAETKMFAQEHEYDLCESKGEE